jgi:DNA-binding transcriptional LysR family regulator
MNAKHVTTGLAALDWDHVRVFLAIARAGQLAGAGARLGLDVSTVSRRLVRLERELGAHLFDRGKEGTTITAAAEAILPAAEEMERALARFTNAANTIETTAEGAVRLTCAPGVADAFVAPLLTRFHERFPGVVVHLDASVGYADLTRREADLALRAQRPRAGDLVAVKVVATRSVPMTSPEYARALGRLGRWDDARWIGWGDDLSHLPSARWMAKHAPSPVLRTSHFGSQLAAAAAGLALVLAPEPFAAVRRLEPVRLAPALEADLAALPTEELWLVGHRALRAVPRIAALWEFLLAELANPARAAELAPGTRSAEPTLRRRSRRPRGA